MPGSMSGTCSTPCVPYKLAQREEALVALDWDFDDDCQSTLALHLVSSHGRATPLVWRTVRKSELKGIGANTRGQGAAPLLRGGADELTVTVLADRGFTDGSCSRTASSWSCSPASSSSQPTRASDLRSRRQRARHATVACCAAYRTSTTFQARPRRPHAHPRPLPLQSATGVTAPFSSSVGNETSRWDRRWPFVRCRPQPRLAHATSGSERTCPSLEEPLLLEQCQPYE